MDFIKPEHETTSLTRLEKNFFVKFFIIKS